MYEEPAAVEDFVGIPALPLDRYHLRAPTFCEEEDVKQFIAEVSDVAAIYIWPAKVNLMQLQLCLMETAKPYVIGRMSTVCSTCWKPDLGSPFETRLCKSKDLGVILKHLCENVQL